MFAYQPAADYIKIGSDLLADKDEIFVEHNELASKLYLRRAKTNLRACRTSECRECAEAVVSHARAKEHKRGAQLVLIKSYPSDNLFGKQREFALDVLANIGQEISYCSIKMEKTQKLILGMSDAELLALPTMADKEIEFCIECRFTPLIYVIFGQVYIAESQDYNGGLRFIDLGLRSEYEVDLEVKSRTLVWTCMGLGCMQPISKCMYLALDGFETGMSAGSVATAFDAAAWYLLSFYYSGLPLPSLLQDADKFTLQMKCSLTAAIHTLEVFLIPYSLILCREYQQYSALSITIPLHQLLVCLSGRAASRMDDAYFRIQNLPITDDMKKNGYAALAFYKMQLHLYLGNSETAIKIFHTIKDESVGILQGSQVYQSRQFYFALISMSIQRQHCKLGHKSEAKKYVDIVKKLVEGGAINLGHKYLLLEAEIDSLSSKDAHQTLKKYEQAVVSSARAGFLQDGALSSVLCARFCMGEPDLTEKASFHMLRAHELFTAWGATAAAESLTTKHPELFPETANLTRKESSSLRSRPHFRETIILKHQSLRN
ncbi:MAG: hypothetical protein SGILL_003480 [Bacillariaceae sp.]